VAGCTTLAQAVPGPERAGRRRAQPSQAPFIATLFSGAVVRGLSLLLSRSVAAALLGVLPALAQSGPPQRNGERCPAIAGSDRLAEVAPDGSLSLATAGLARLSGIRLADDGPHRATAIAWLVGRVGQDLTTRAAGPRDRWGRIPVRLAAPSDREDLAAALVAAGLAMVDPTHPEGLCDPQLLATEQSARERGLGLWAEARYKPLAVDAPALGERAGQFAIVEGRIRSIGEREQRTYLNFGSDWSSDFTIILPRRVWTGLVDRGFTAGALRGRRIRARGILENWQGTAITVIVPEMLEVVHNGRERR
jgi:Staphylococcal nuclease homologue